VGQAARQGVGSALVHLIEEEAARRALDEAESRWEGAYSAWEAATWTVMRDPLAGKSVTESGKTRAFTYEGARSIKQPSVTILYENRGDTTVIHDAFFKEAPYFQAGRA